jgi:hypothetical protein
LQLITVSRAIRWRNYWNKFLKLYLFYWVFFCFYVNLFGNRIIEQKNDVSFQDILKFNYNFSHFVDHNFFLYKFKFIKVNIF